VGWAGLGHEQTVLAAALEVVTTAAAPMLPHLAEDAWLALPWPAPTRSVFQARHLAQGRTRMRTRRWTRDSDLEARV
jgi:isoleucyl-tRNA synthetase